LFTKAEVRTSAGDLLTLQLVDDDSGITIENFDGLGPVKATLSSSQFAGQDISQFQGGQRAPRNITLSLGLDPDPTVTTVNTLRRNIYKFFRTKMPVNLKFFVDDTDDSVEDGYAILGYTESCEPDEFTQTPTLDISIMCYDPDFQDPIPVVVTGLTTADTTPTAISYAGTTPTGMLILLNVNASISEFTVYYTDPNSVIWTMDVAVTLVAGDQVTISTIPGSKYANLLRAGVTSSILYAVSPQSTWPLLAEGNNGVRIFATGSDMPATITYTKRFGEL
jgi:hypothetical protein